MPCSPTRYYLVVAMAQRKLDALLSYDTEETRCLALLLGTI